MGWHTLQVLHKKLLRSCHQSSSCSKTLKSFSGLKECQNAWEDNKNRYVQAPILISPNWKLEFHVHTYASQLAIGAIFIQNPTIKFDQPIMYACKLLNSAKRNYTTTKREPQLWSMIYTILDITYQVTGLYFMLTTWPLRTQLTNHKHLA